MSPSAKKPVAVLDAEVDRLLRSEEKVADAAESPTFEEAMNPTRDEDEVKRLKSLAEREFIDTHDSWVLDMSTLIGFPFTEKPITVEQLRTVLAAAGLEMEVRVWRA